MPATLFKFSKTLSENHEESEIRPDCKPTSHFAAASQIPAEDRKLLD